MITSPFGSSGFEVSRLGLGAGGLGDAALSETDAERLLLGAIDEGITFIDAARSYGLAEERIGRHLGAQRHAVVLSTKGGYGADGASDWTGEAVTLGIEGALARMQTDRIDVFHLHSCPRDVLAREDIHRALDAARHAGKIRVAAYSGEGDALDAAVESATFGGVQCSVNVFDQRNLGRAVALASRRRIGVVAKRPLANAAWRFDARPVGDYAEEYWTRMHTMGVDPAPLAWSELALRFAAFAPGVTTAIVGTTRLAHVRENARWLERGPLAPAMCARVRDAFAANDAGWMGQI